ncbi:MAG: antibiotic biosynthesis monooxygenase [candidate division Zixibacteria bacterium]|nr:antibiotic biosynthesis monooxygenase [candidate division Zixibacteria bacterium]NIS45640.1 antibiotic biosynthesis monooxygenase [candidate division Zixibacteria bacterium]NIU12686.1 antibiotic biosynthesis monooxygenase [candidate division Zixibacteria bacterium]NIV05806.1 antibiotic biosynthesis monooxygenase [candidate division Zixibacteria bacterium]NIW43468.1 antibiotic biosynthesis monooxygenase [Gammaproteobacteria bacterium]
MYAMTGKLYAKPGKRDQFIQVLLQAAEMVSELPECHMYLVTKDISNEDTISVIEIWDTKEAHDASLKIDEIREIIRGAMPLMGDPPKSVEMEVIGGYGLNL